MAYAIISVGGKQYRVQEGQRLLVDRLPTDEGKTFQPQLLMVGGDGKVDFDSKTTVTARVVGHVLGEKIIVGKYRRRTGYKRHNGHRSKLSQIEIEAIGTKRAAAKPAAESKPAAETKPAAEEKPKAAPKPKAETKPKAPAKPKAEAKPKATAAKPAARKPAAKKTPEKK